MPIIDLTDMREKAITIAVMRKGGDRAELKENLEELNLLAETANVDVIHTTWQELAAVNRATMLGKGKVEELKQYIEDNKINVIIFDDDLTPMQVRNLEKEWNIKVMDRSGIILSIFAKRAKTSESITQVELAQMQYMLPRLTRMWTHLSKQFGGVGTKGPGETQIETDRRIVRQRIDLLKDKLKKIDHQNEQKRKSREDVIKFALVGYTNAGKSTLMKAITNSDVYIKDELFATLDTTVRGFDLPSGTRAILSDTVGFIRKLPTHLVASFRSTLAEAKLSDFILHVVDVSSPNYINQVAAVEQTLEQLNIDTAGALLVFNKIDAVEDYEIIQHLKGEYPNSVFISAKKGFNIEELLNKLQAMYDSMSKKFKLFVPYTESQITSHIYNLGEIVSQESNDEGTLYNIKVSNEKTNLIENKFAKYLVG